MCMCDFEPAYMFWDWYRCDLYLWRKGTKILYWFMEWTLHVYTMLCVYKQKTSHNDRNFKAQWPHRPLITWPMFLLFDYHNDYIPLWLLACNRTTTLPQRYGLWALGGNALNYMNWSTMKFPLEQLYRLNVQHWPLQMCNNNRRNKN